MFIYEKAKKPRKIIIVKICQCFKESIRSETGHTKKYYMSFNKEKSVLRNTLVFKVIDFCLNA